MSIAANRAGHASRASLLSSPLTLIAASLAFVAIVLMLPVSVPIGPMYWDVMIYYDAANRIFGGQVPSIDFFAPVGPLGYYLFAGWLALFPNGHPALLAHWSLLAVTAPLIAVIVADIDARARGTAFAVLIPFLFFALLPFNTREFYPYPGSDAFGIYNRQGCQLLYVLVAAFIFVRNQRRLAAIVCAAMLALFFVKITGFVAGVVICGFGFASGRLKLLPALACATGFAVVLAGLELWDGFVSHYVEDILALVDKNSGTIAPRFLQAASTTFGVVAPISALILVSLYSGRRRIGEALARLRAAPGFSTLATCLNQDGLWLGVVLFSGILYETQNTGSQAMIFLWPVVLAILLRSGSIMASPKLLVATLGLAAAAMLPLAVNIGERTARTYIGGFKNEHLVSENLKTLGAVNMRPEVKERVDHMLHFYPGHQELYTELVLAGELPTPILYSDFDFQIIHMIAIDRGIASIRKLEAAKNIRFETIMSLNFVNPLPWLMDRSAPKHIAIGADPGRAVPRPGAAVAEAVEATDLVLYPKCPLTTANADLYAIYKPMLAKHLRIALDACFDAFVNPRFAGKFAK